MEIKKELSNVEIAKRVLLVLYACLSYIIVSYNRICPAILAAGSMPSDLGCIRCLYTEFAPMFFWSYAILQPFIGAIVDLVRPAMVLLLCQVGMACGDLITAQASTLTVACFGRVIVGLCCGGIAVPVTKILSDAFSPRGFILSQNLMMICGAAGSVLAQLPLQLVLEHISWRTSFLVITIVAAAIAPLTFSSWQMAVPSGGSCRKQLEEWWINARIVAKDLRFWMLVIWGGLVPGAYYNVTAISGVRYLQDCLLLSANLASTIVMALPVAWIVGSVLFPSMSEWLKTRKWVLFVTAFGSVASSGIFFAFKDASSSNQKAVVAAMFFFGLFSIGPVSLSIAMVKEMEPVERVGTALGIYNALPFLTSTAQQHITAAVLLRTQNDSDVYKRQFLALWLPTFISCVIGLVCACFTRETYGAQLPSTPLMASDQEILLSTRDPDS